MHTGGDIMGLTAALERATRIGSAVKQYRPILRDVNRRALACSECSLKTHCVPADLEAEMLGEFDRFGTSRMRIHKGDTLYRARDRFSSLYAVRSGSCKTLILTEDGHEQVTAYHMPGEILGFDGIDSGAYFCQVVALEDTELCVLPYEELERLAHHSTTFQRNMHRLLSREIARDRRTMLMLGTMRAEQRLVAFLLDLAQRYHALGYSSCEFVLRMTREEIGSFLGLKLETVSRLFSRFHHDGLIQVQGRVVKLLDRSALERIIGVEV